MQNPQITYNNVPGLALNGQVDQCSDEDIISRTASAPIGVGTFCMFGPAAPASTGLSPGQIQPIPDGTSDLTALAGVAILDVDRSPFIGTANTASGSGQYQSGDVVGCLRKGRIWMWAEGAVTQGHHVYVRCTASGVNVNGQVIDGATTNFVQHPTATFFSSTTGAGPALVEVK